MSLLYRKKQGILDIIIYEKTKSEFSYLRIFNNCFFPWYIILVSI